MTTYTNFGKSILCAYWLTFLAPFIVLAHWIDSLPCAVHNTYNSIGIYVTVLSFAIGIGCAVWFLGIENFFTWEREYVKEMYCKKFYSVGYRNWNCLFGKRLYTDNYIHYERLFEADDKKKVIDLTGKSVTIKDNKLYIA